MKNNNSFITIEDTFAAVYESMRALSEASAMLDRDPISFTVEQKDDQLVISAQTASEKRKQERQDAEQLARMRERQRREWIDKWYGLYAQDAGADVIDIVSQEGYVVVYRLAQHPRKAYLGEAFCNPTDCFDARTGIAIAYARTHGETIPDYI